MAGKWKTIDSAPKYKVVLVCDMKATNPEAGQGFYDGEIWRAFDYEMNIEGQWPSPTHWRDMPELPVIDNG